MPPFPIKPMLQLITTTKSRAKKQRNGFVNQVPACTITWWLPVSPQSVPVPSEIEPSFLQSLGEVTLCALHVSSDAILFSMHSVQTLNYILLVHLSMATDNVSGISLRWFSLKSFQGYFINKQWMKESGHNAVLKLEWIRVSVSCLEGRKQKDKQPGT